MDFTDRTMRQPQQTNSGGPAPAGPGKKPGRFHKIKNHKLLNITYVTLLFSITILIVGVVLLLFLFDGNRNKQEQFVDTGKYQAVFLNGGQVYFGKIGKLNSEYMALSDIYYLTPNQAVQSDGSSGSSNNFTIRKLGCELHRPQDVMLINNDQIIFWENLKDDDSQNTVPGAIKKLAEQPQDCNQQGQSNSQNNNNPASEEPAGDSGAAAADDSAATENSNSGN
ncbi:MAG TPA: hypothetical protein VFX86_04675 [Candidatus Saccharimonadales bacterium]|nr:hypothetical protein [Candidatus Saccharimonadales bacterium]